MHVVFMDVDHRPYSNSQYIERIETIQSVPSNNKIKLEFKQKCIWKISQIYRKKLKNLKVVKQIFGN